MTKVNGKARVSTVPVSVDVMASVEVMTPAPVEMVSPVTVELVSSVPVDAVPLSHVEISQGEHEVLVDGVPPSLSDLSSSGVSQGPRWAQERSGV